MCYLNGVFLEDKEQLSVDIRQLISIKSLSVCVCVRARVLYCVYFMERENIDICTIIHG